MTKQNSRLININTHHLPQASAISYRFSNCSTTRQINRPPETPLLPMPTAPRFAMVYWDILHQNICKFSLCFHLSLPHQTRAKQMSRQAHPRLAFQGGVCRLWPDVLSLHVGLGLRAIGDACAHSCGTCGWLPISRHHGRALLTKMKDVRHQQMINFDQHRDTRPVWKFGFPRPLAVSCWIGL